jgi:hypothetical protein
MAGQIVKAESAKSRIARMRAEVASAYKIDEPTLRTDMQSIATAASSNAAANPQAIDQATFNTLTQPLVPDLESIEFDTVSADPDVRDRLVEHNLDEALRYLQACNSLRAEYVEKAKVYVDTRLKTEEFFRLDDVHQQEVAEGLYGLPHYEANEAAIAYKAALAAANEQKTIVTELKANQLSQSQIDAMVDHASKLARASTNVDAATASTESGELAKYRGQLEKVSWDYSEKSVDISAAELQAKFNTASKKAEYLKKDITFRSARAAISRQLAYTQLWENSRHGSALNFLERLSVLHAQFEVTLKRLIARVLALKSGAHTLYNVDDTLDPPARGSILDSISLWLAKLQDDVIKYRKRERTYVFSVPLKKLLNGLDSISDNGGANLTFVQAFTRNQGGLLRGVAFEYVSSSGTGGPLTLSVQVPRSATDNVGQRGQTSPASLVFGRVLPVTAGLDLRPQHCDIVWNGSPYGQWNISAPKDAFRGLSVDELLLYVWMAFPS